MLFSASYADSLTRSESMTTVTSSMVMLVSGVVGWGVGGWVGVNVRRIVAHRPPLPPRTRHVCREDDLALPRRRAPEDERLLVARQAAVEVQDVHAREGRARAARSAAAAPAATTVARRRRRLELAVEAPDLGHAGEEHEDRAVVGAGRDADLLPPAPAAAGAPRKHELLSAAERVEERDDGAKVEPVAAPRVRVDTAAAAAAGAGGG